MSIKDVSEGPAGAEASKGDMDVPVSSLATAPPPAPQNHFSFQHK